MKRNENQATITEFFIWLKYLFCRYQTMLAVFKIHWSIFNKLSQQQRYLLHGPPATDQKNLGCRGHYMTFFQNWLLRDLVCVVWNNLIGITRHCQRTKMTIFYGAVPLSKFPHLSILNCFCHFSLDTLPQFSLNILQHFNSVTWQLTKLTGYSTAGSSVQRSLLPAKAHTKRCNFRPEQFIPRQSWAFTSVPIPHSPSCNPPLILSALWGAWNGSLWLFCGGLQAKQAVFYLGAEDTPGTRLSFEGGSSLPVCKK